MRGYYLHRTMCDVLYEMRQCFKSYNFTPMKGLIEELQSMANRMEAGLGEHKDLERMNDEWHELKNKIEVAREELGLLDPDAFASHMEEH